MGIALLWLLISLSIVTTRQGRNVLVRYLPQMALCTAVTVAMWLSSECLLHVFAPTTSSAAFHLPPPNTRRVFQPNASDMPGVIGESRYTISSLGVRGPELPPKEAAYRILCVGGSTTQCLYLDDSEAWPHVLEVTLNRGADSKHVWVGNVGIAGYSTAPHLRFIAKGELWKRMDCILFLVGANDLNRFLRFGSTLNQFSDEPSTWELKSRSSPPIWNRSAVLKTARRIYYEQIRPQKDAEDKRGANYAVRRRLRQRAPIRDDMPDLSEALNEYGERIARIIELCKSAHVRPVFLTQPTLLGENASAEVRSLFWSGDDGHGKYFGIDYLRKGLDRYNQRLREVCSRERVEVIDLTTMNGRGEFFYDDYHFTESGAREVARLVAKGFAEHAERDQAWAGM
jgi:lysophospholipase L1-like esterase